MCRVPVRYEKWHERQVLDQGVANEAGGMGDGWVEDDGFEDGRQKLEELKRVWDWEMERPLPLFDGAPSRGLCGASYLIHSPLMYIVQCTMFNYRSLWMGFQAFHIVVVDSGFGYGV